MLSWFIVDVIAAMPIDIFSMSMYNNSTLSLPNIYKNIRIIRIFKLTKLSKYNESLNKALARFKFSAGTNRIAKFIILAIFIVHLIACIWFL